jgi:hypothetical protein
MAKDDEEVCNVMLHWVAVMPGGWGFGGRSFMGEGGLSLRLLGGGGFDGLDLVMLTLQSAGITT